MGYDKKMIDKTFIAYIKHKNEKILGRLLISCNKMIDVVLSQYVSEFFPYLEDLHQDIQIKLMKSLRINPRLGNYVQSPSSYLFFKIRLFANVASSQCRKMFDMGGPLTKLEEEILLLLEEENLTVAQIAERLGLSQRRVNARYNSALRKRGTKRMGSSIMQGGFGRHRRAQPSADILEERTSELYSIDPLNQLLIKEIVEETLDECLSMIDNHEVYREDAELRDSIKEQVKEMFLQEFGGALL